MDNRKTELNQVYDNIRQILLGKGLDYWKANEALAGIDAYVVSEIGHDLAITSPKDRQKMLAEFTDTKPTSEQMCLYLGITTDEFDKKRLMKLQEYMETLPAMFQVKS